MRKVLMLVTALALAVPSLAGLGAGDILYNPDLDFSGLTGTDGPFYTDGLPSWAMPGGLVSSLTADISGVPGFDAYTGTVESYVYYVNGVDATGGLGFAYRINLAADSAGGLVRASLASANWAPVDISDAGSDNSGSSTFSDEATLAWDDGDPYFIERDAVGGNPQWQFRLGIDGTSLDPEGFSALVWFQTDATFFTTSSVSLLNGGAAGAARVLAVGVPTPAAVGLGMLGLLLVGRLYRRA